MRKRYFYQSIESVNIGAFPLLPDASDPRNEGTLLHEFLTKILTTEQAYDHIKDAIPQKGLQYESSFEPAENDLVLVGYYKTGQLPIIRENKLYYVPTALDKGSINLVSGFERTKYLLLHHGSERMLLRLKGDGPKFYPRKALEEMGFAPTGDYFLGFEIKSLNHMTEIDISSYTLERKGLQQFTPYFTTFEKITNPSLH